MTFPVDGKWLLSDGRYCQLRATMYCAEKKRPKITIHSMAQLKWLFELTIIEFLYPHLSTVELQWMVWEVITSQGLLK